MSQPKLPEMENKDAFKGDNNTYWPLCKITDIGIFFAAVALFMSVTVICVTLYLIASQIGF